MTALEENARLQKEEIKRTAAAVRLAFADEKTWQAF